MLVMSRRQDEKIVFPGLGVTITLVNVRGSTARLGIDAPREITVLREEIAGDLPPNRIRDRDPHAIRNVLNSINLSVMLYQRQMECGRVEEAAATFMKMVDYLECQTQQGGVDFRVDADESRLVDGHVMIVEDDEEQRGLLTSLLTSYGLEVSPFENGRSALEFLKDGCRPGVIVLDWTMPEFGGAWLVPKIHREFGEASPKLFVLSGTDRKPSNAGVDAWLAKPVNHEALLARIRAAYSTSC